MGRSWRRIGVSFQAVSHLRLDGDACQVRKFEKRCHRREYPMRFASFLVLLLIPAFTLAQTCGHTHDVGAVAVPFPMVSGCSKSVQGPMDVSQAIGYRGVRNDFLPHFHDGMCGIESSAKPQGAVPQGAVPQGAVPQYCLIDTPQAAAEISKNVHLRNHFDNSWAAFAGKKKGTVAFIGGSITEMNGYRVMVEEDLRRRFPGTDFTFVNAGISSTCSTTGAHRLARDVLSTQPDLLFVEFAVNDDQDASHAERECRRGMEGILRQARVTNPAMDIVVTHFVNPPMLELLKRKKTPVSSGAHEAVAAHYGVSTIDLAREVAERIEANELTWATYGGTHPKPAGNRIAADMIEQLLDAAWANEERLEQGNASSHKLASVLDPASYSQGRLLAGTKADFDKSWVWGVPAWESIPGGKRGRFIKLDMLCTDVANAELTLDFDGQAIGLYVLAGPDAGRVEYSVDGGKFKTADLFHRFSKGLHYPRTVMLATGLKPGAHRLTMRVAKKSNQQSKGNAVRILEFVTN